MSGRGKSIVGSVLGHAMVGAFIGYTFIPTFLGAEKLIALAGKIGLTLARGDVPWVGAALGATVLGVLGVISGRSNRARQEKRIAAFEETAKGLGSEFSAAPDTGLNESLQSFFAGARMLEAHNVMLTELAGVRFQTADITYETRTGTRGGTGNSGSSRTVTQTVAFCKPPAVRFPTFTLQPEGMFVKLLSGAVGIEDIDFPAHPDFSEAYHLTAAHAERTRALFNRPVLDALTRHRGLHIASDSEGLVIYRSETLVESDELKAFVTEAAEIFRLFRAAADAAAAIPEMDARAAAEKMPGLMGRIVRKRLVTRADIDAFIGLKPPRKIPANILLYRDQVAPGLALVVGSAFLLAGVMFAVLLGQKFVSEGYGWFKVAMQLWLPLIFVVVGAAMLFFIGRKHIRVTQVLRRGRVCEAEILEIRDTGSAMGNETTDAMVVRFQPDRRTVQASFKLTKQVRSKARSLLAERMPARILYDPANPTRILFVDALLNAHSDRMV